MRMSLMRESLLLPSQKQLKKGDDFREDLIMNVSLNPNIKALPVKKLGTVEMTKFYKSSNYFQNGT